MVLQVQFELKKNPYYIAYLRNHSYWYKTLNRDPNQMNNFIKEFKEYNRLEKKAKVSQTLQYIEMLGTIMSSLK